MTAITIQQRLTRLRVLIDELSCWRVRSSQELASWSSDGEPLSAGERWPGRRRAATMTHPDVTVPAGWPLDRTRLRLDLGDEALVEVRYPDGPAPFAVDLNHRELPVRGRTFSVHADAVARHEFGDAGRDPRLTESSLILLEPAVDQLVRRLSLLVEAGFELGGHEVVPHLVHAAEVALGSVRLPSETTDYIRRTAVLPRQHGIWRLPDSAFGPVAPLADDEVASVVRASDGLQTALLSLRERFPKQGTLAVTGHAHIDLAWLWPMDETRLKARRTFSTMTSLFELEQNRDFRFNQSSAQIYAFLEQDDPALFERVQGEIAAGRWEPVGGMWVEPDTNMPTGESLTRQLLYGQRYFERTFGRRHRVCWLPDCFGFTAALPQLLRGAGIDSFFTVKLTWQETNRFPYDLFRWQGLDSSEVLVHMFENPRSPRGSNLSGYNGDVRPVNLITTWANFRGKVQHDESLLTIGAGDGGGGPQQEMLDDMVELAAFPVLPEIKNTTVDAFFDRLRQAAPSADLPKWAGELYFELHRGTLTTQGRTKRMHRQAERTLLAAETLGAMVALRGGGTPPSLEPLWQVLLRNEFHDILPGSSIREVYELTEVELAQVIEGAGACVEEHLDRLVAGFAGDRAGFIVVNPGLAPRPLRAVLSDPVEGSQAVEGGHLVAEGGAPLPGLSVTSRTSPAPVGTLRVEPRLLENDLVRIELGPDAVLTSVWDKRAGREALDGRANQLWAYVDKPREWDAWDVDASYADVGEEITDVESWEVTEQGPFRAAIRVRRRFRNSTITQDLRLWANSARLDIRTTLDWHDRRWLLKARFPLTVQAERATFECAYGVVQRPTTRNTTWEAAKFEVPGHRFADLSEPGFGVALLNDGRYGHHALGNELGLSLLRSPIWPDPLADDGTQVITYALYPHAGDWLEGGVLAEADDLNQPLRGRAAQVAGDGVWTAAEIGPLPVGLGTFKVAEDGDDLVLRVYEPRGSRGAVTVGLPEGWRLASELNLLEDEIGEPELSISPFQVRSWKVSRK